MPDYSLLSQLLELPNVRVTGYEVIGSERVCLVIESTLEAGVCPDCHQISEVGHGHAELQQIRDLAMWQRQCCLHYWPRRFKCVHCQTTFVERVLWREADFVYTHRYEQALYERARHEPIAQIAAHEHLSEDIVRGIFERWAKKT